MVDRGKSPLCVTSTHKPWLSDLSGNCEGLASSTYASILMPQHRTIQALMRAGGYAVICYDENSMRLDYFRKE